jgi:hypothetical protein
MEDPEIILRNIQHYRDLLTLYSTDYTREQVLKLLGEAQERLPARRRRSVGSQALGGCRVDAAAPMPAQGAAEFSGLARFRPAPSGW